MFVVVRARWRKLILEFVQVLSDQHLAMIAHTGHSERLVIMIDFFTLKRNTQ